MLTENVLDIVTFLILHVCKLLLFNNHLFKLNLDTVQGTVYAFHLIALENNVACACFLNFKL